MVPESIAQVHDDLMKSTLTASASLTPRPARSSAELMSDSAVYRRTARGQRALAGAFDPGATPDLRLLARLNGFTELRRLIDLSPEDGRALARAIPQLFDDGLIELVDDAH
jgi:hypothetical protein